MLWLSVALLSVLALGALATFVLKSVARAENARFLAVQELERTAQLTAALSRATSVDEVSRAMLEVGLPALEAAAGAVALLSQDGKTVEIRGMRGFGDVLEHKYTVLPLDSGMPITESIRRREPLFIGSPEEMARLVPAGDIGSYKSWAALPLEGRGRIIGSLVVSFSAPRSFDMPERERLQRIASHCGQAFDRALLFESENWARKTAEVANQAKDQFLAMLGHELRNPLAPILTALDLMRMTDNRAFVRERAIIERQTRHMVRLVDDLLDVSRISRGKIELKKHPVQCRAVQRRAIEAASPLLEQRQHRVEIEEPAPDVYVNGDEDRLVQVLTNLLVNAAKYTDPGGHIRVYSGARGERVIFAVEDNGQGVSEALQPRVFDLFSQDAQSIDRSQGGLGLGLAIAKSLVELHGGELSVTSDGPGLGSTFFVTLPLIAQPKPEVSAAVGPASSASKRRRVLVIEDNRDAAEMLADALRRHGHNVRIAYDGPSGLVAADEFTPELALVDIGLPAMDGYEVARHLTKMHPEAQLVAVTGYGTDADRHQSAVAGFAAHLVKPIDLSQALAIIDHL